ncbi:MAG: hypothetical protein NTW71_09335 [Deltaproteobacteria bacterium]|nr:hypothetical protein [Deltaproteobacteria bacterium]
MRKGCATGRKRCLNFSQCAMVLLLIVTGGYLCGCSSSSAGDANPVLTSRQECLGVPNCVSVEKEVFQFKNEQAVLHFVCPENAPYLWNWDAERHRDVSIALESDTQRSMVLHMIDHNTATTSSFKIYLGCSPNDLSERTIRFTHVAAGEHNY